MSKGISDFGNGYGYLYETAVDGTTILSVDKNTVDGARNFKRLAVTNAPVSADRSAVATITITGCASIGNITQILINGVNQLGAALPVSTSVNATLAALTAAAINAYTPPSGTKQTAYAIGAVVYVVTAPENGAALNGQGIIVSVSDISITTTTTDFVNGSSAQGVYDVSLGRRYFIDADYGAAGIVGSSPAVPDSLTYAFEITKWVTQRGSQAGTPVLNVTIGGDTISNTNRYNSKIVYSVETQGGAASDVLAQLNPADFLEGDEIILRCYDATHVVTVESAPVTTSAAPTPNIYLLDDQPFVCDSESKALSLLYHYNNARGAHFVEIGRSDTPGGPIDPGSGDGFSLLIGNTVFVSKAGNDAQAAREDIKYHFLTVAAAMTAAQSGDTVVVYPGTYDIGASIAKNLVTLHLMPGAILSPANGINTIEVTGTIDFKVTGNGKILANGAMAVYQNNGSSDLLVECDEIVGDTGSNLTVASLTQRKFYLKVNKPINPGTSASAVDIGGGGEVVINADMIDQSGSDADRTGGSYRMLGIYGRTGTGNVTVNGQIIGRQYGPTVVLQNNSAASGIVTINGDIMNINTTASQYNTCCVITANIGTDQEKPNAFINGNLIAYGSAKGINGSDNTGQGRVVVNGNIYTQNGPCVINASSGVAITVHGDCYQSGAWTVQNAIIIGYDDAPNYMFQGGRTELNGRIKSASNVAAPCYIDVSSGAWPTISGLFLRGSEIIAAIPSTAPGIITAGAAETLYAIGSVSNRDVDLSGGSTVGAAVTVDYNFI